MTNCIGTAEPCNGDDWSYLSVLIMLARMKTDMDIEFDDVSNMNGGYFPIHKGHQNGLGFDAWFDGYNNRGVDVFNKLVQLRNRLGSQISQIGVTFTPAFHNAVNNAPPLADGTPVNKVFFNWGGHGTHFHITLSTKNVVW